MEIIQKITIGEFPIGNQWVRLLSATEINTKKFLWCKTEKKIIHKDKKFKTFTLHVSVKQLVFIWTYKLQELDEQQIDN